MMLKPTQREGFKMARVSRLQRETSHRSVPYSPCPVLIQSKGGLSGRRGKMSA